MTYKTALYLRENPLNSIPVWMIVPLTRRSEPGRSLLNKDLPLWAELWPQQATVVPTSVSMVYGCVFTTVSSRLISFSASGLRRFRCTLVNLQSSCRLTLRRISWLFCFRVGWMLVSDWHKWAPIEVYVHLTFNRIREAKLYFWAFNYEFLISVVSFLYFEFHFKGFKVPEFAKQLIALDKMSFSQKCL